MIFVTVGTHEQPMNRLMDALEGLPEAVPWLAPFIVQHGYSRPPRGWQCFRFLEPAEQRHHIEKATVIISHAGPATIGEIRAHSKVPVVVPRFRRYREHVDDHQVAYARRLARAGEVIVVEDVSKLVQVVAGHQLLSSFLPPAQSVDPEPAIRRFRKIAHELLGPGDRGSSAIEGGSDVPPQR